MNPTVEALLVLQERDLRVAHLTAELEALPDQIAATERLKEVDVKPDAILSAFFNNAIGLSAHA